MALALSAGRLGLAALLVCGLCHACFESGSVLEAQGPYHGQLTDNVFEERLQDYRVQRSIQYVQQLDSRWRIMYTRRQPGGTGFDDAVFFEPMRSSSVCEDEQTSPLYAPPLLSYAATGFLKYKQGRTVVTYKDLSGGPLGTCSFTSRKREWQYKKVGPDLLNLTYIEDIETQKDCQTIRRKVLEQWLLYKVVSGCVLDAKPSGCVKGVSTCRPCKPSWVTVWFRPGINRPDGYPLAVPFCLPRTYTCPLSAVNYKGCRSGYSTKAVTSGTNASVTCQACEPHTFNSVVPEDVFAGLNAVCSKCGEYNEAVGYASTNCHRCKAGWYAANKFAPLNCTPCPPGSTSQQFDNSKCTKCPGGFYQDHPGQTSCKKCPTDWKCLVPTSLLDKFQYTPYRWDKSGHPQCLSLDGKECWKDPKLPCAEKLKQIKSLSSSGKLKAVTCGPEHKKLWGTDGYSEQGHWCPLTKQILLQPGPANVGATNCTA
eukprot:jgi/Chrzof1/10878/Cz05g15210.t1